VMVDVGALPPGNYTVGISDPSVIGGASVTGAGLANPNGQTPSQPAPAQATPPTPPTVGNAGAIAPSGAATPVGNGNASNNTSTNQGNVSNNQPAPTTKDATIAGPNANGAGTLNQIGTITVDQSGTGRMQQRVESAQVRNVVGQAIVLYSQNASSPETLPADLGLTKPVLPLVPRNISDLTKSVAALESQHINLKQTMNIVDATDVEGSYLESLLEPGQPQCIKEKSKTWPWNDAAATRPWRNAALDSKSSLDDAVAYSETSFRPALGLAGQAFTVDLQK